MYHFIEKRKLSLESHKLKFIALSSAAAESIKFMAFYCEAVEKYKKPFPASSGGHYES
jgi:hypothetical protein